MSRDEKDEFCEECGELLIDCECEKEENDI